MKRKATKKTYYYYGKKVSKRRWDQIRRGRRVAAQEKKRLQTYMRRHGVTAHQARVAIHHERMREISDFSRKFFGEPPRSKKKAASPRRQPTVTWMVDPRIVDRVRKLLALSQSPNRFEAELAARRAHEIIARHGLRPGDY